MTRWPLCVLLLGLSWASWGPLAQAQGPATPAPATEPAPVGVPRWKRDLVIEGSEVEVSPAQNACPMVLRIADVYPHGSAFRYDIEYYGLEAGDFDLRDFLKRKDASSLENAAPIPVHIESSLAPEVLRPNAIQSAPVPAVGGYVLTLWILAGLWLAVLVAILGFGRKRARGTQATRTRPQTLADRLRPLVLQGLAGELQSEDCARLELTLIAFWRRKLSLQDENAAEALAQLKQHAQAGPLLAQLELWLHSPGGAGEVNPQDLLAPYEDLDADEFEGHGTPGSEGQDA